MPPKLRTDGPLVLRALEENRQEKLKKEKDEANAKAALKEAAEKEARKLADKNAKQAAAQAEKDRKATEAQSKKDEKEAKVEAEKARKIAERKIQELNKLTSLTGENLVRAKAIPISGQWVTFPYPMTLFKTITWQDGMVPVSANYYYCKCWYGVLSKETEEKLRKAPAQPATEARGGYVARYPTAYPNTPIEILGQSTIYVSQEYAEPQTRGLPLKRYHLADLAGYASTEGAPRWLTMKLDDCVHYGSSGLDKQKLNLRKFTGYQRWLVYHPPAAPLIPPPSMWQHRFTEFQNFVSTTLNAGIAQIPTLVDVAIPGVAATGAGLGLLTKGLFAVFGHPLHPFLDDEGMKEAKDLLTTNDDYIKAETDTLTKERASILTIERHRMTIVNEKTDKEAVDRLHSIKKELQAEQLNPDQRNPAAIAAANSFANTATEETIIKAAQEANTDGDHLLEHSISGPDDESAEGEDSLATNTSLPDSEATGGSSTTPLAGSTTVIPKIKVPEESSKLVSNNLIDETDPKVKKRVDELSKSSDPLMRNTSVPHR